MLTKTQETIFWREYEEYKAQDCYEIAKAIVAETNAPANTFPLILDEVSAYAKKNLYCGFPVCLIE